MRLVQKNGHWIVALLGAVSLAYSAGLMRDRLPLPSLGVTHAREAQVAQAPPEAEALSSGFRHAAKAALPAMVSIEVRGKAAQVNNGQGADLDELFGGSPFGDMFKRDPRFKEFFKGGQRQMPRSHGMGSGFVIDPSGIILTANHVVADADEVKVKLNDGREFMATEVKTDPSTDVAIVRIKADGKLPFVRMGNSDAVEIGEWVVAIGSPFGFDATVTAGIISAKGRGPGIAKREDFLQTDAAINPGNSGGPLVNLSGEVVGINTAISTRSGGYDGIGFAVPINLAKWVADQLIEKGNVSRAYLGVAIQPVDSDLSKQFNVPVGKGAIVTNVMPGSPAAAAKVEAGDLVVKFDGKEIHGPRDLQGVVERLTAGQTYAMHVMRDGKELTMKVTAKEMPKDFSLASHSLVEEKAAPEAQEVDRFADLGIEIEAAKPDVLQKLGFKSDTAGVVVTSVAEDSPAAQANIHEGMVIEKVGSKRVTTPAEFKDAVHAASLDKGILVLVRTPRGSQFVVVRKSAS